MFLAAATELHDTAASVSVHAAGRWIDADTTLLRQRLGALATTRRLAGAALSRHGDAGQ